MYFKSSDDIGILVGFRNNVGATDGVNALLVVVFVFVVLIDVISSFPDSIELTLFDCCCF